MTQTKSEIYVELLSQVKALTRNETDIFARLSTTACVLHQAFDQFFWTGFYRVDTHKNDELVIGPYQGTLGCLRIPFSQGVCGACATGKETLVVEDVHAFPGHIACDSRSNSEIVVPVFDGSGQLYAVLDVDSTDYGAFDAEDKAGLEAIVAVLFDGLD